MFLSDKQLKFGERLKLGQKFEKMVENFFLESGLQIFRYGLGTLPETAKKELISLNDPTSLLLRFSPDFFCVLPHRFSFYVECKSSRSKTSNFSYALDSYEAGLKLSRLGIRILVVFGSLESELKAQWLNELPILKRYTDRKLLRLVYGSQKPFVLMPKAELPSLDIVLERLKYEYC